MDTQLPYDKTDPNSIHKHALKLLGKSLRNILSKDEIDNIIKEFNPNNKGEFGLLIEKHFFKLERNNRSEPDFSEAKVELKTAGLERKKGRFTSKEPRLSLGMIDYTTVCNETWENSSLLRKNSLLLLMFYLFDKSIELPIDYTFKLIDLWKFPERDLRIIRQDWLTIVEKIKHGKAHELSEGDTYYLGASTHGANSRELVVQPETTEMARRRGFSLKKTYVDTIIADLMSKSPITSSLIKSDKELVQENFEQVVIKRFKPFLGQTVSVIASRLGVPITSNKAILAVLARAMMGIKTLKIKEFEKADIAMKTIRLDYKGKPMESMSFPYFKYTEIINEEWDDSTLREQFSKKFFFVIFEYGKDEILRFKKSMFWNMPYDTLEGDVRKVWEDTVKRIRNAHADALPKRSEYPICYVKPHGRNSKDTLPAPGGHNVVKKCFWLDKSYIGNQVKSYKLSNKGE